MSIAENYLYSVLYQVISIIIPFITIPYVSRVLGAEGIGINAYTGSIVSYFALFGSLGIGLYASRSIAYVREDRERLSKTFWSIFLLQLVLCIISFIMCILFIIFFMGSHKQILLIQSIGLLSIAIDISWLFVGIEDLKKLVVRSIIFRILGVLCIFLFVKSRSDLWKYIVLGSVSGLVGQIMMWVYLHRIVDKCKLNYKDVVKHLKPSMELFLPQVAIQIYLVLNRTMLGIYANKQEVGFYESSDKIIKMALALVTATGGVMLPRIANSFAKGDNEKVNNYVYIILNFVSYLAIPIMVGIIGISGKFVPWFFGKEFIKCRELIIILSPIIIAIAWSNVFGFQYLIPTGKVKEFTISVVAGAIVNLILNLILIRKFYSIGSAIATVIAEFTVTGTQMFLIRKDIRIFSLYRKFIKYNLSALVMFVLIQLMGYFLNTSPKTTLIQVASGIIIYVSMLFILKSDINNFIIGRILSKIYHKFIDKEAGA